jgi:hypothetical protein
MRPEDCAYAPFYCEENVWHLAGRDDLPSPRSVVVVTNPRRTCALWAQRAAREPGAPVVWDYHVLLVTGRGPDALAYDLDSTLGLPVELAAWTEATFPFPGRVRADLLPFFRLVDAERFRATFASDRSHMQGSEHPEPPWPRIATATETMNLERWLDLGEDGDVVDADGLRARYGLAAPR